MDTVELIFWVFAVLTLIALISMTALAFYAGRSRVKAIDKIAHGFEIPHDSIFFLVARVPNYGNAFLWKWYAKRMGLEGKIDHFDWHFRWPFVVAGVLGIFGIVSIIILALIDQYAGITN